MEETQLLPTSTVNVLDAVETIGDEETLRLTVEQAVIRIRGFFVSGLNLPMQNEAFNRLQQRIVFPGASHPTRRAREAAGREENLRHSALYHAETAGSVSIFSERETFSSEVGHLQSMSLIVE